MRALSGILAVLTLSAYGARHLPTRVDLEIYEVEDLVYTMDSPGVSISLDPILEEHVHVDLFTGEDLAGAIQAVLPLSSDPSEDAGVTFQNGMLIVRATRAQHTAVDACLAVYRFRNAVVDATNSLIAGLRSGNPALVFGSR